MERDTILVIPYDPQWPAQYEEERTKIILAFRDYLRTHPDTAHAYAELKIRLAQRYPSDREAYSHAKTDFVRAIEALVLHERPLERH